MRRFWFLILISLFVASCGYKPVQKYAKNLFENPVLVKVKLDPEDPENGEYLEDEIAKMAINRLNLTLTKNVDNAKGYIIVNNYTINTTPANKDDDGNVIRYSINAAVEFAVKDKYGFWSKNIVANEYVSVKAQSILSSIDKAKAGKLAIKKALDAFVIAVINRANDAETGKIKPEPKPEPKQEITPETQEFVDNYSEEVIETSTEYEYESEN
jgi:hypothetical protein